MHDVGKTVTHVINEKGDHTYHGHDEAGAVLAEKILLGLKADSHLIEAVKEMVDNHMKFREVKEMRRSTLARFMARPTFDDELKLHWADCMSSNRNLDNYNYCLEMKDKVFVKAEEPKILSVITGDDLIHLGYVPGPLFKILLKKTHDYMMDNSLTSKEEAIKYVKNWRWVQ